jgi:hypothetical protein
MIASYVGTDLALFPKTIIFLTVWALSFELLTKVAKALLT